MKRSFFTYVLFFVLSACFASDALASTDPIPGVDVVVRKKPSGASLTTKTNQDGGFSLTVTSPGIADINGVWEISIDWATVQKALANAKDWDGKSATLTYSCPGLTKVGTGTFTISNSTYSNSITVSSKTGGTISGRLTYEAKVSGIGGVK